jgi:hypothetical protein
MMACLCDKYEYAIAKSCVIAAKASLLIQDMEYDQYRPALPSDTLPVLIINELLHSF